MSDKPDMKAARAFAESFAEKHDEGQERFEVWGDTLRNLLAAFLYACSRMLRAEARVYKLTRALDEVLGTPEGRLRSERDTARTERDEAQERLDCLEVEKEKAWRLVARLDEESTDSHARRERAERERDELQAKLDAIRKSANIAMHPDYVQVPRRLLGLPREEKRK